MSPEPETLQAQLARADKSTTGEVTLLGLQTMGYTPTFDMVALLGTCGAFITGLLISLLPLPAAVRKRLIAAGLLGAIVGLLIGNPQGLDGIGWAMIGGYSVLGWFAGLALGYFIRRIFHPTGGDSLWSGLVRLVSLR